jgi:hypothetical protein
VAHCRVAALYVIGSADDLSVVANNESYLHGWLLSKILDRQVVEQNYFQVERHSDTGFVPDLELVENLRCARVTRTTAAFGRVEGNENVSHRIIAALPGPFWHRPENDWASVGAGLTEPVPIPKLRLIRSYSKPAIDTKMTWHFGLSLCSIRAQGLLTPDKVNPADGR